ncbi:30S ribosomal protein S13 [Candidatus Peregrinibacteria bacterium]|nr:30S ribosomal protein S13 [Candidatus Peregrinibacteria bacterium]
MARIAGINLPKEKRIAIGLTAIYGIGRPLARKILEETNIDQNLKVQALTEDQVNKLRDKIAEHVTEGDLRRKIQLDVKFQQDIGTYRGTRHKKGLPVRGQQTKTNSRTRKGKKKTVANKKIATK